MTKEEVESQVRELVVDKLQVAPEKVKADAKFDQDLGADSLDLVDLMMDLEDKFGLKISDEEAEDIKTVNDVVDYIVSKSAA